MKSPFSAAMLAVVTPTTLSSGGRISLATAMARYLSLNFDQSGSGIGATSIDADVERGQAFAEAAGADQLGVVGLQAALLQEQHGQAWLVERGLV